MLSLFRTSSLVLAEKPFVGDGTPPAMFYDASRFKNNGSHTAISYTKLPSGLHVRRFNGTSSLVASPITNLSYTAITMLIWVNQVNQTGGWHAVAGVGLDSSPRLGWARGPGTWQMTPFFRRADGTEWAGTSTVLNNQWMFLVYTWVPSLLTHYVNGLYYGQGATGSETSVFISNYFGLSYSYGGFFGGYISLPRVYSRSLSAIEIANIYEAERGWFGL